MHSFEPFVLVGSLVTQTLKTLPRESHARPEEPAALADAV